MAADLSVFIHYADMPQWQRLPASFQALGEIADEKGRRMLSIAFAAHRDIITEIGYQASESCPDALRACAACICELAQNQAIMAAELLGPKEMEEILSDGDALEDQNYYYTILATLALKNAIASYADYKKADLKAWKARGDQNL